MATYKVTLNKDGYLQLTMTQRLQDGRTVIFNRAGVDPADIKDVANEAATLAKSRRPAVVIN